MASFSKVSEVFDGLLPWRYRIMRASAGTTTGMVVLAILGRTPPRLPTFGRTCDILLDGRVVSDLYKNGVRHHNVTIGSLEAIRDNLRRLADHCKLRDADRIFLFDEFRKWVRKDYRALAGLTPGEK